MRILVHGDAVGHGAAQATARLAPCSRPLKKCSRSSALRSAPSGSQHCSGCCFQPIGTPESSTHGSAFPAMAMLLPMAPLASP
eukprot:10650284-Prorocentrum_lima.AAC.1